MGFQQGLSGLNASSKNLDVIGHNIANSGTVGFKASRTEFAEMVASAIGTSGGINAGIGVQVGAVAQQFSQGNISVTGNSMDVAINGNGFFILQTPDGSPAYTRAGNFKLDDKGNLVTNSGDKVMGSVSGKQQPLTFPTSKGVEAKRTENITASFNLYAGAPTAASVTPPTPRPTYGTSINVYDDQGVATPVSLYFVKNSANTWDVYDSLTSTMAIGQMTFDGTGKIQSVTPIPPPPPPATATGFKLKISIDPSPSNPNSPTTPPATPPGSPAPAKFPVDLDFSNVTQFGTKFAVTDLTQDGYTNGQLTGINIGADGTIMSSYSNGVARAQGQIALASFRNTQGLTPIGNNNWASTAESGPAVPGQPGSGNLGALRSGALEDSNVDLTAELVNMMTAQRAYQANAQTIKTQDQVMSTLVNLR